MKEWEPCKIPNGGQRLVAEFAGIFLAGDRDGGRRDTTNRWVNAPVQVFVGLLAERFTRERLHAAAHAS
jgi:hypothetical protein